MAKTHTVNNSEVVTKGATFNIESLKAISQSLSGKIAFTVGGCLMTEVQELNDQVFNLFEDAQAGRREANNDVMYIPRMERVRQWKGFAVEHEIEVNFQGYLEFMENEINERYNKAKKSKYNRDLDAIIEEAKALTGNFEKALVLYEETKEDTCYTPEFLSLLYPALQASIDVIRKSINKTKYPYNKMEDEELDGIVLLLNDLEKDL